MTAEQAAAILKKMYDEAPQREKVIQIHLFGIKYANEIADLVPKNIAIRAGISESYGTEINKARNLAPYVRIIE